MRICVTSVFVDDQDKALRFYTEVLGFVKKNEIPLGEARWLTVVSPEQPDGHRAAARAGRAIRPYGRTRRRLSRTASRPPRSRSTTSAEYERLRGWESSSRRNRCRWDPW